MRLRDLDAVFLGAPGEGGGHRRLPDAEGAQGILFQCPKCAEGAERAAGGGLVGVHYVRVWFANPVSGPPAPADLLPAPRWVRIGETLETLTLSPSIHLTAPGCGWHGFVRDGAAA